MALSRRRFAAGTRSQLTPHREGSQQGTEPCQRRPRSNQRPFAQISPGAAAPGPGQQSRLPLPAAGPGAFCFLNKKRLGAREGQMLAKSAPPPLISAWRLWTPRRASSAAGVDILWWRVPLIPLFDSRFPRSCRPQREKKEMNLRGRGAENQLFPLRPNFRWPTPAAAGCHPPSFKLGYCTSDEPPFLRRNMWEIPEDARLPSLGFSVLPIHQAI